MTSRVIKISVMMALVAWCTISTAHRMTERYIPIGQSPGISGKYSTVGVVKSLDRAAGTVTVDNERGETRYTIDKDTHIWVDRNRWKLKNLTGSYKDCEVGVKVEIMYRHDNKTVADWIKVEATDVK